ncbi:MAG: Uma2 family endonuclease [Gemmataceae bacterium]|nr:Uma2 family endonuclease [Gemmataceae bacterium]
MPEPALLEPLPRKTILPPLEAGDRLSRAEFERRYEATPKSVHAELLEGEVYFAEPKRWGRHTLPQGRLLHLLLTYQTATPGSAAGGETTLRLDEENEPQPDVVMFVHPKNGGQATIDDDEYLQGAPELVGEIAASSVSIDMHKKLEIYRRNPIREYVVWRVFDEAIDWFAWRDGKYVPLPADEHVVRSEAFPGLWINVPALLADRWPEVQKTLQAGLSNPEHAAFGAKLHAAKTK